MVNEEEKEFEVRRISKEMCEILDRQKEKINEFAWDCLKISDVEASKVIARKIKDSGLI